MLRHVITRVSVFILIPVTAAIAQFPPPISRQQSMSVKVGSPSSFTWRSPVWGQVFTERSSESPAAWWSVGTRVDLSDIPKLGDSLNEKLRIESFEISFSRSIGLERFGYQEFLMTWESERLVTAAGRLSLSGDYDQIVKSSRSMSLNLNLGRKRFTLGGGLGLEDGRFRPVFVLRFHGHNFD